MHFCPLRRVRALLAASAVSMAMIAAVPAASAQGYMSQQMPYAVMASCVQWNPQGQCTHFQYKATPVPSYGGLPYAPFVNNGMATAPSFYGDVSQAVVPRGVFRRPFFPTCDSTFVRCTGELTITARAVPMPAMRDEPIIYTVYVRNDGNLPRTVHVWATLDDDVTFTGASDGAVSDGRIVQWNAVRVEAGQSRTLLVRGMVRHGSRLDEQLMFTAQTDTTVDTIATPVREREWEKRVLRVGEDGPYYTPYGAPTMRPTEYPLYNMYGPQYYGDNFIPVQQHRREDFYRSCDSRISYCRGYYSY